VTTVREHLLRHLRADLRLLIMSATLDGARVATLLDDALVDRTGVLPDLPRAVAGWHDDVLGCSTGAPPDRGPADYQRAMARAYKLSGTGRGAAAVAAADEALAKARDARQRVRARIRRIQVDDHADLASFDALFAEARATGDANLPGDVAVAAAEHCSMLGDTACTRAWADRLAETLQTAAQPSPLHRATLAGLRGDLAVQGGDEAIAVGLYEEELQRLAAVYGDHSWRLLPGLIDLAGSLLNVDRAAESLRTAERADAIVVRWVGEDHPFRFNPLWAVGNARWKLGDHQRARTDFERAIALRVTAAGNDLVPVIGLYSNLAGTYEDDGDIARALELTDRATAVFDRAPERDDGTYVGTVRQGAALASTLGRDDARARSDRAIALAPGRLGAADVEWGDLYQTRAIIELRAGALDEAAADLREALSRFDRRTDLPPGRAVNAHARLAAVALRRHRLADARAELDLAAARLAKVSPKDGMRVVSLIFETEYALAAGQLREAQHQLERLLPNFDDKRPSDPRLAAHLFMLTATVNERLGDRDRAAAQRDHALGILRDAHVPEAAVYEDCIACPPGPGTPGIR